MKVYLHSTFVEPEKLVEVAKGAEAAGFYGITVSDHVVYPADLLSKYPLPDAAWPPTAPWPEPFVAIGAMAGATENLHFMTCIYIAPMRPVLEVAKLVSTASVFCGGRLKLGIGAGWMREEFDLMGTDFDNRGPRMDEMIEVLRTIWKGGNREFHGEYYDIPPVAMYPTPPKPIPIICGGDAPVSMRRAARSDGWIGMHYYFDEAVEKLELLRTAREKAGTADREDYEITFMIKPVPDVDTLKKLEELGVTSVFLSPWEAEEDFQADPGLDSILRSIDAYGATIEKVRS